MTSRLHYCVCVSHDHFPFPKKVGLAVEPPTWEQFLICGLTSPVELTRVTVYRGSKRRLSLPQSCGHTYIEFATATAVTNATANCYCYLLLLLFCILTCLHSLELDVAVLDIAKCRRKYASQDLQSPRIQVLHVLLLMNIN